MKGRVANGAWRNSGEGDEEKIDKNKIVKYLLSEGVAFECVSRLSYSTMYRDMEEELKPKWEEQNSYIGVEMWDEYWRLMRLKYGEEEQNNYVGIEMWNEYWRLNGIGSGDAKIKFREKCKDIRVKTRMLRELEDKGWAKNGGIVVLSQECFKGSMECQRVVNDG